MFIILSGCSGSGKNTVIGELLKRNSNLKFFRTCTTRENVRTHELEEGQGYIHLTREEFENKIKNGEFYEYEEIHGYLYGTLKESVNELISGKNDFIKDLGVLGQKSMVRMLGDKVKIISIFLDVPREELIRRLELRGEKEIEKRMSRFDFERSHRPNFNLIIPNDNFEKTVGIIENIIKNNKKS
jgi:guanylate kinase